jgi:predicted O-methyltransferase YrrM
MQVLRHYLLWSVGLARAATQTTDAERACIARHAAGRRRLAEVGVFHGVTTCVIRKAMADDATLFAVDPYPRGRLGVSFHQRIAHREVNRLPHGQVVWLRMTGAAAARHVADRQLGPIDFVFLDGDHSYEATLADWQGWRTLMAPGGAILLHDSCSSATRRLDDAGSARVTQEVIRRDPLFEVVEVVDTLTVVRRKEQA